VHPIAAADEGSLDHRILTFLLLPIPHPDSRAAAVLVDELDAGGFQSPASRKVIRGRHGGLAGANFKRAVDAEFNERI
jgi:hypothetical protein